MAWWTVVGGRRLGRQHPVEGRVDQRPSRLQIRLEVRTAHASSSPSQAKRPGGGGAGLVLDQHLDAALRFVEVARAVAGQRDALLEDLERVLQRQVARLQRAHDLLEPREAVLKLEVGHRAPWSRRRDSRGFPRAAARAPRRRRDTSRQLRTMRRAGVRVKLYPRPSTASGDSESSRPAAEPSRWRERSSARCSARVRRRRAGRSSARRSRSVRATGLAARRPRSASATRCAARPSAASSAWRRRTRASSSRRARSRSGRRGIGQHAGGRASAPGGRGGRRAHGASPAAAAAVRSPTLSTTARFSRTTSSAALDGCGGAHVGDEVGDGEVHLVAHGGDHRHLGGRDGPGQHLVVEGPQVLERAAAAAHDDHVHAAQRVQLARRPGRPRPPHRRPAPGPAPARCAPRRSGGR